MALDHVRQEILAQAKREAAKIRQAAAAEIVEIRRTATQRVAEYRAQAEAEHAIIRDQLEKQELASARFEAKKLQLNARRAMIEQVFTAVRARLATDRQKQQELLVKLRDSAEKEIAIHTVYVNARDADIVRKWKGVSVKSAPILGGLIAANAENTLRVDYSYDLFLEQLRERELATIAKELS